MLSHFLYKLFEDKDLLTLLKEQFVLSKYAHISLSESDHLTEAEREAYLTFVLDDLKKEAESLNVDKNKSIYPT